MGFNWVAHNPNFVVNSFKSVSRNANIVAQKIASTSFIWSYKNAQNLNFKLKLLHVIVRSNAKLPFKGGNKVGCASETHPVGNFVYIIIALCN